MAVEQWLEMRVISEISLVPDMSNPESDIVIVKAAKPKTTVKTGNVEMDSRFEKLSAVLTEASARNDAGIHLSKIRTGFDALRDTFDAVSGSDALTPVLKAKMIAAFDNFGGVLSDSAPSVVVAKSVAETMAVITSADDGTDIIKGITMDLATLQTSLDTATAEIKVLKASVATITTERDAAVNEVAVLKSAVAVETDNIEEIVKGMAPAQAAIFRKQHARIAANDALIQKMADESGIAETVTILKAAGVPDFDKVGPALYRIEKGRGKAAETVKVDGKDVAVPSDFEIVKAGLTAKAKAAKAPLKPLGSGVDFTKQGGGEGGEETAFSKMTTKAEEIKKAAETAGKPVTIEQAFAKAMNDNPALYVEYRNETAGARASAASH